MTNIKESKAKIGLGRAVVDYSTFYIGFLGMILYRDGRDSPVFSHSYTAYADNLFPPIYLAGFDIVPGIVFDYMQACEKYARYVGQEMKRYGIAAYELKNGSPDTGIVFDESIGRFAYLRTDGAKMDPIPDDGIERFKKTLEECLQS